MNATDRQRKAFLESYIVCALWSSPEDDNGEHLDANYSGSDLTDEARTRCEKDCDSFLRQIRFIPEYHNGEYTDSQLAGHDFLLTRNGHGVGFWDGDFGDVGDELTDIANKFGEIDIVECDDGTIEMM